MSQTLALLSLCTCALALGVAWLGVQSWIRSRVKGGLELGGFMLAVACWSGSVLGLLLSPELADKRTWLAMAYVGVVSIPLLSLSFAARVTLDPPWLRLSILWPLGLVPLLTVLLAFTDDLHGLMLGPSSVSTRVPGYLEYPGGLWYWVHSAYSYLLILGAVLLLFRAWQRHRGVYRLQLGFWLAACLVPFVVNVIQQFSVGQRSGLDLTPASLSITGMIVLYGLSRRRVLLVQPRALELAFERLPDGVMVLDSDLHLLYLNAAAAFQLSAPPRQALGEAASSVLRAWSALEEPLSSHAPVQGHVNHTLEGREYEYRLSPIQGRRGQLEGHLLMARDVTEIRRYQRHIKNLAYQDPLTKLSNRRHLFKKGQELLAAARREGQSCALLYVDLDRFKPINDLLGHEIGDRMLGAVADRLRGQVKADDLVARNGGDEFVLLLRSVSRAQTEEVARRLEGALVQPYRIEAHELSVGVSLGWAMYPEDGTQVEELLHVADRAMYQVKERRKAGRG